MSDQVELKSGMRIDPDGLRRYVETRVAVTKRVDRVVAVMHLLGLLKYCACDAVEVSPMALAVVADLVDADVTSIQELLDDWLYQGEAEKVLAG
jgi:hypothetical protein